MLSRIDINLHEPSRSADEILKAWENSLIVHMRAAGLAEGEIRDFYERLLPRIGSPVPIAEDVRAGDRNRQRTGALWMEVRFDPHFPDAYRHSFNAQPLHTDGSYIPAYPNATLMCCLRNAAVGGETIFISANALQEAVEAEAPHLLERLYSLPIRHARSGDSRIAPLMRNEAGRLHLNWNYYCVASDSPPEVLDLREAFFDFLQHSPAVKQSTVAVKMVPGDAVAWKDEGVLHGRNAFQASAESERFIWKCAIDIGVFAHA